MLPDFLQLIPAEPGTAALVTAMIGTIIGAALWLLGAKVSRPLVTLATVLGGATIGMQLPRWCGWSISGAGPAVGAAVVLGTSGYVLHRMWVGIGLGAVLALWATFIVWALMHDSSPAWAWPTYDGETTYWAYAQTVWESLPAEMRRIIPFAWGTALVSGVAAAILWPKFTTVMNWSALGVTLLSCMGVAAMSFGRRSWLEHLPEQAVAQAGLLLAMVAVGAVVQWKLAATPAVARPAKAREGDAPEGG